VHPLFRDPGALLERSRHWVEIGLIAVPMTLIIATGGIDLSVASLMILAGCVAGACSRDLGLPLPLALGVGLLAGLAGGALNGAIVSGLRVPALVVTLATMAIFRGLAFAITRANPVSQFPLGFVDWGAMGAVGRAPWLVPQQLILLGVVVILGELALRRTRLGRWSVQIGENPKAARFAVVPVARVTFWLYTLSGLACAIAGILFVARFGTAHPGVARGKELEVIACVIIGGTRITGGAGSVVGTFLGVLIIGLLRYGLTLSAAIRPHHEIIIIGLLVIVTAILNEWLARRSERAG
jgi:rhamnose transport system permease protein